VPNLECQWPNFALVTVICQGLYNFWLLPYFWSGFLMSKFGFSYVYPKCFWMRFQWYKFQVLIINDSKVRQSFRGPIYRLHWGCSDSLIESPVFNKSVYTWDIMNCTLLMLTQSSSSYCAMYLTHRKSLWFLTEMVHCFHCQKWSPHTLMMSLDQI
jgi:hypothetical protein